MELSPRIPDLALWRHYAREAFVLDGVSIPGLVRDIYRFREEGEQDDMLSCATYDLNGVRILTVWGIVGGADCCKYHALGGGEPVAGPPTMEYNQKRGILIIDSSSFLV